MKIWIIKILLSLAVLSLFVSARSPQDCASVTAPLEQRLESQRRLLADWAGLIHYGSVNTELPAPKTNEDRVVFLGDEITENWGRESAQFFPSKPYLNRGVAGQTTPQMLVRFRQDVIALKPKVVVIQAGMNDIASLTAPITQGMFAENIMSIVELAKANNIRVVLASLTPICDCYKKQTTLRPQGKIIGMNGWLKEYAAQSGSIYLNYYSAMAEGRNLKKELTGDGLLPNDAGYAVMAPLAEQAIAQALSKK
ncbi:MAG TPA: SGNH/GDSL hydrolase family protein [Blastocatellia bacterium]